MPKTFPLKSLVEFNIGSADPENDTLLNHNMGICLISPAVDFLQGSKSLIVGPRGTGKTTLFKLLSERKITFKAIQGLTDFILPIDEMLNYSEIKAKLYDVIDSPIKNDDVKCCFFWEVFILYRLLAKIAEAQSDLPKHLHDDLQKLKILLGYEEGKVSITNILSHLKFTGGLKFDHSAIGTAVTPIISVEKGATPEQSALSMIINLENTKAELNTYLLSKKLRIIILFDNLDAFVVKEEYTFQKHLLEGLLECERGYLKYKQIELKLFLRSDLYERLNFESIGYEKMSSRKVDLLWSKDDIARLIAQRIAFNLMSIFKLDLLSFDIDQEALYLNEGSAELNTISPFQIPNDSGGNFVSKSISAAIRFIQGRSKGKGEMRDARLINFNDAINRELIASIFPRYINHRTEGNGFEECALVDFIDSHLSIGSNILTPRIVIMFIGECLLCTKDYYRDNPDIMVQLDEYCEYKLIKKKCVNLAYDNFRDSILNAYLKNLPTIWKPFMQRLIHARESIFYSFKDIEEITQIDNEIALWQFVAFLCHIGFLVCENPNDLLSARQYYLPIVFRK